MDNVVDLSKKREEQNPHVTGTCICLGCKHEWVAVSPAGTTEFECPSCTLLKGVHKYLCEPEDGIVWQCKCGNDLFVITTKGNAMCPNCGNFARIND